MTDKFDAAAILREELLRVETRGGAFVELRYLTARSLLDRVAAQQEQDKRFSLVLQTLETAENIIRHLQEQVSAFTREPEETAPDASEVKLAVDVPPPMQATEPVVRPTLALCLAVLKYHLSKEREDEINRIDAMTDEELVAEAAREFQDEEAAQAATEWLRARRPIAAV